MNSNRYLNEVIPLKDEAAFTPLVELIPLKQVGDVEPALIAEGAIHQLADHRIVAQELEAAA